MRLSNARRVVLGTTTIGLAATGGAIAGYTQGGWTPGIGGLVGAVLGFMGSSMWARAQQDRADKRQALAARDSVLIKLPMPISLSGPSRAASDPSAAVLTTRAPSQLLVADRQAISRPWERVTGAQFLESRASFALSCDETARAPIGGTRVLHADR